MRNNHTLFFISLFCFGFGFAGCKSKKNLGERLSKVVVYSYSSFVSDWGPGPLILSEFEKDTGLRLEFIDCGESISTLTRAITEKNKPYADVIIGIDNNLANEAIAADVLAPYLPTDADKVIDKKLLEALGGGNYLIPFDYGYFTMIFDSRTDVPEPKKLADLADSVYQNKIILMDPRTSTPGLGFALWTKAVFGDDYIDFWRNLRGNLLTVAPGWSAGYGLFTKGEAPLVISYNTSPAANIEYDDINYFKALMFEDGHLMQVEGAGILKNAPNEKGAKLFMDYLISEKAQGAIPKTQWMYPANKNTELPDCYKNGAPLPQKTLSLDLSPENLAEITQEIVAVLEK